MLVNFLDTAIYVAFHENEYWFGEERDSKITTLDKIRKVLINVLVLKLYDAKKGAEKVGIIGFENYVDDIQKEITNETQQEIKAKIYDIYDKFMEGQEVKGNGIKDWHEAIKYSIDMHQAILDGKYQDYDDAKRAMAPPEWEETCPLCAYGYEVNGKGCEACIWYKFTGDICTDNEMYDYKDDAESVDRLKDWDEEITRVETMNKELGTEFDIGQEFYLSGMSLYDFTRVLVNWSDAGIIEHETSKGVIIETGKSHVYAINYKNKLLILKEPKRILK